MLTDAVYRGNEELDGCRADGVTGLWSTLPMQMNFTQSAPVDSNSISTISLSSDIAYTDRLIVCAESPKQTLNLIH